MYSGAYQNKSGDFIEIETEYYKVSFYLSNDALFELIAHAVAEEIIAKVV